MLKFCLISSKLDAVYRFAQNFGKLLCLRLFDFFKSWREAISTVDKLLQKQLFCSAQPSRHFGYAGFCVVTFDKRRAKFIVYGAGF